jgi:LCP family protein required for cell wall assembly
MFDETHPNRTRPMDEFQPIPVIRSGRFATQKRNLRWRNPWVIFALVLLLVYFFGPLRTNLLILGTDDSPERGALGRTDTIILATVVPFKPYVGLLSIPRDLWLPVPGVGEQRINTAYFFAEAQQPGSGSEAAMRTIRENFGVPVRYYALIHMDGLVEVIDALGGVDLTLELPSGGLGAGTHHLDGTQALAFARERYSSDDFSRMRRGQLLLQAVLKQAIRPTSWPRLPLVLAALNGTLETNLPAWQLPRLSFALLRAAVFGIDSQSISREMVTPFQTSGGAQVLAPNWEAIKPVVKKMFGK